MLDKLASFSSNNITMDDFITINGLISQSDIITAYNYILNKDAKGILDTITKIDACGYDFGNFIERLMIYVRDLVVDSFMNKNEKFDVSFNVDLVNKLNDLLNILKNCLNPLIMTQISLLNLINVDSKKEVVVEKENLINVSDVNKVSERVSVVKEKNKETNKIKNNVRNKTDFSINESVKSCRINNALAEANLAFKNAFVKNWNKISEYRIDQKYAKVVQLLEISTPMVVSDRYVIIGSKRDSTVERMYENYVEIEDLLMKINNHEYYAVYVTEKDFEIIKNQYINDKKNGIIYKYQDEKDVLVQKEKKNSELVDKALNIFGSDLVDIEEE